MTNVKNDIVKEEVKVKGKVNEVIVNSIDCSECKNFGSVIVCTGCSHNPRSIDKFEKVGTDKLSEICKKL